MLGTNLEKESLPSPVGTHNHSRRGSLVNLSAHQGDRWMSHSRSTAEPGFASAPARGHLGRSPPRACVPGAFGELLPPARTPTGMFEPRLAGSGAEHGHAGSFPGAQRGAFPTSDPCPSLHRSVPAFGGKRWPAPGAACLLPSRQS